MTVFYIVSIVFCISMFVLNGILDRTYFKGLIVELEKEFFKNDIYYSQHPILARTLIIVLLISMLLFPIMNLIFGFLMLIIFIENFKK